jgi:hypothetical protein
MASELVPFFLVFAKFLPHHEAFVIFFRWLHLVPAELPVVDRLGIRALHLGHFVMFVEPMISATSQKSDAL